MSLRFDGESAESDVPDNLLFLDGNQRHDQSIGLTKSFNEPCLAGLAEGHLEDVPDSRDVLGGFCADCDHQVTEAFYGQDDSIVICIPSQL